MQGSHLRLASAPSRRMMTSRMSRVAALALFGLLAACAVGPTYSPPAPPPDKQYSEAGAPEMPSVEGAGVDQHFALGGQISAEWWKLFHSPPLDEVLTQSIAGNRSLAAATASLAQAHEAVLVATAGLYPQLDFGAAAERERNNFKAVGLTGFPPKEFNVYSFGPSVSFTISAGIVTRRIEQQAALEQAQSYQLQAAYLTLTGSAVAEVITIASVRAQMKAVEDILADDQTNLDLVRNELRAGTATDLDVETASSQLASDRTLLPPLRQQLNVAQHALAVLTGKTPAGWTPPDFDLETLSLPEAVPVSVPSDLMHQRPDIMTAEAQLHAASAAIGVATAQLYPSITLNADVMQQFLTPGTAFDPSSNIWGIGANLTAPLFHGGELQAEKRSAEDAYKASLALYQQTVLTSFGQVADLLDGLAHDAALLAAEQTAFQSASATLRLTRTSYALGNATLLQILDAQRILEQARLGLVRAQAQRYLDTAQLFVAMGGGWWDRAAEAAAR